MSNHSAEYLKYFLDSPMTAVRLECIEFSHSAFSRVYRIVRNNTYGLTVTHEDGKEYEYEYYPLQIERLKLVSDLDSGLRINLGDLGDIIHPELARVMAAQAFEEKPLLSYRSYVSTDTSKVLEGPLSYEIESLSKNREGASLEATAPPLNQNATGERYTFERFPALRGFL